MTSKEFIDLNVGAVIDCNQSTSIEYLSWEDIILSESEDFWSMQILDCDQISIELPVLEMPGSPDTSSSVETERSIFGEGQPDPTSAVDIEKPWSEGVVSVATKVDAVRAGPVSTENKKSSDKFVRTDDGLLGLADTSQKLSLFQGKLGVSNDPGSRPLININANAKGACDITKMFVRPSSDSSVKKLCCPFCMQCFSNLQRHLESMHKTEQEVKDFVSLPKGSKERRQIQDDLRKLGLYKWNGNADVNKNELIPSRRPSGNDIVDADKWTTCPYCLGPYTKTNLRHHAIKCHKNPGKGQRMLNKLATIVEGRIHESASNRLAHVMGFMRQDHIVEIIKYDWLLIVFGNKMCCKYTPHYQENMIRARLRLTGRLLFEIRKIDPNVTDFSSIYHVERYKPMVDAIKRIGRFDPETNEFGAPAMASFAVTFIRHIGKYLSAEYILLRDRENKIETEDFLAYMDTDIGISINKLVAETQSTMRRQTQQNIPTMEDVKKLIRHINTERNACIDALSKEYSDENWLKLGELSMAWIIVFNRRRVGEAQNILIDEFLKRQSIDDDNNEQMMSSLSDESKAIARKFKRMKIRGKKGRTVPVLLKPSIEMGIELFISQRQAAGVSINSRYLFELPASSKLKIKVVDGCQTLRKLSELCGAQNPTSLRGTHLRKHMATTCVTLDLNDALVSEVARYMGHSETIHRDIYRQNTIDREVVQMSKVLEAAVGKCDVDDDDEDDCVGGEVWPTAENGNDLPPNLPIVLEVPDETRDEFQLMPVENQKFLKRKFGPINIDGGPPPKNTKTRWTNEEISSVQKAFAHHFKGGTLPVQSEIEERQEEDAHLRSRTWQQIKAYVNNQQKKK